MREVPAEAPTPEIEAPPLEVPAIAIADRAPLDPAGFLVTPPPREPADRNGLAARRAAAFRLLDQQIDDLIKGLEKRGQLTRTIIALVSTGPAPRPQRAAPPRPDLLFEDWLRGLALIQTPGMNQPGQSAATLALLTDVAPTLASLAGASSGLDGKQAGLDLSPAVRDPKHVVRKALLASATRMPPRIGRSVRSNRFRFTQWPDGSEELFDEQADPHEWTNLASAPAMQAQKRELAQRLERKTSLAPAAPARPTSGRRLNVVMIIADDLTAQYPQLGDVKTPNLDRLRARGRSYEKAYAPAPFCTPSRAAFLSGLSPARLQLQHEDPFKEIFTPRVRLMQEQFQDDGYFTASVGKVWDSQPGETRGWDLNEWAPPLPAGKVESPARLMKNMPVEGGPTTNEDDVEGDGRRARFAVKVLEEKREKPLFLALGLVRPHVAWIAPQKYFDLYPPDRIKFSPAPANDLDDIPAIAVKNQAQALPRLMLAGREPGGLSNDPEEARRGLSAYFACVTFMDAQLGVVLDALDRGDRWKDTIVVFFGDNGHHLGDHGGLWRKNTLFEESLRVPMVVAMPDLPQPGVATNALADLIDIYPTLVDLTGIARPGNLDGVSLKPTLLNPKASVQDTLIQYRPIEPARVGYSLRTTDYRYTLWPDGSEELYDLRVDPAGFRDVSKQDGRRETLASLRKSIESMVHD
ncbi:MAG: sulfatase-like hydrolase/transferase [Vicinamibacteria bacterium]|nr:sulfatase-like hydrolase/transferase [Vicinamibacteria bacterium]